jgi:hypothetical protein
VLLALWVAVPLAAHAQLTCGGTIGPGGTFTMTSDITSCPGTALTVVGPVVLDMALRDLSCTGLSTGLRIEGKGARVQGGRVFGCTVAVDVGGSGSHKVQRMRAVVNALAFGVSSDGNVLAHNAASSHSAGFQINGNRNKLVGNLSVSTSGDAFQSFGNGNAFTQNAVQQAARGFASEMGTVGNVYKENTATVTGVGFAIDGAKHTLKSNTATRSAQVGYRLQVGTGGHSLKGNVAIGLAGDRTFGTGFDVATGGNSLKSNRAHEHQNGIVLRVPGNVVTGNVAIGNGTDGADVDPACTGNTWKKNVFHVVFQDCVR